MFACGRRIKFEIIARRFLYRNYIKYYSQNLNILIINSIFFNTGTHFSTRYAENLICFSNKEFLSRFYTLNECIKLISELADYYTESIQIYPNYFPLNEAKYIFYNILKKQSLVNEQEKIQEELNKNKNKISSSLNSSESDAFSRIFNSKVKKEICNINDSTLENLFGVKKNKHLILDLTSFKDELGEVKPNVLYCNKENNRDSEKSLKDVCSIINTISNNERQMNKIGINKKNSIKFSYSNVKAIRLKKKSLIHPHGKSSSRNKNSKSNSNHNLDLKTITFYKYGKINSSRVLNEKKSLKENLSTNINKKNSSNIINLTENFSIKKSNIFRNSKNTINVKNIFISNINNNNYGCSSKIKIRTNKNKCRLSPKLQNSFKNNLGKSPNTSYSKKKILSNSKSSRSRNKKKKQTNTIFNNGIKRIIINFSNSNIRNWKLSSSSNNSSNNTINSIIKNNNVEVTKIYINSKFHKKISLLKSSRSNKKLKEIDINYQSKIRNRLYNGNSYKKNKNNAPNKSSIIKLFINKATTRCDDGK